MLITLVEVRGPQSRRILTVANIEYISGSFTMYDIYTTAPYNYIANGYLDPVKEGPTH